MHAARPPHAAAAFHPNNNHKAGGVPSSAIQIHAPFSNNQQQPQNGVVGHGGGGLPVRTHVRSAPTTQSHSLIAARKRAAQNPTTPTTLTASALVEPRLAHVEQLLKDVVENITAVDNAQTAFEHRSNGSWITADVVADTMEFCTTEDDVEEAMKAVKPTPVSKGGTASVAYPMVQGTIEGSAVFLMRRRTVDPSTAELAASWIVVHTPVGDVAHVTNFRF